MIPVLSLLIIFALVGAIISFVSGKYSKSIALIFSALIFIFTLYIVLNFKYGYIGYQYMESYSWINTPYLTANYVLGIDGISLLMLLLTAFLFLVVIIYSWDENHNVSSFFGLIMLEEMGVLGVFLSLDFLLFFIFWELSLVPMFFLIAYWGGKNRNYAAYKFFIYTHVAGVIMLVSVLSIYFYSSASSLDFSAMTAKSAFISPFTQFVIFLGLLFGFGTKMPIVPMHTWLPDAHVEAPTAASAILAGLLLKMGAYGLIRLGAFMLPSGRSAAEPLMLFLGILSIAWGTFAALSQKDLKKMIAYSSISHMGMVLIGIAVWSQIGVMGAVFLMFAHGLVSPLLFMSAGSIHHSYGTREIPKLGGLAKKTPIIGAILVIASLASLGLPSLIGFPAEFSILYALYSSSGFYYAIVPIAILAVTAGYYIWALQRAVFGPYKCKVKKPHDLPLNEFVSMGMLISLIVLYGILPFLLVNVITSSFIGVL
jgi:NADH-quinone oxidoreductase subunit M